MSMSSMQWWSIQWGVVVLTSVCENPNGHFASRADLICLPDTPDGRKRADGIGNIVGTVTETRDSGGHTRLEEVSLGLASEQGVD